MGWEIEFYENRRGEKPVEVFLDSLQGITRNKVYKSLELLKEFGVTSRSSHVKKLTGTKLWELRILGESSIRIFYVAVIKKRFLILHAFIKKTQKTPHGEIKIAQKRLVEYITKL